MITLIISINLTAACTKDEACTDSKCQDYKGKQTKTRSGKTCQKWSSMTPHMSRYPLLPSNYCRNPDGEPSIWCYTTDPNKRWDYCDPICTPTTSAPPPTTTGIVLHIRAERVPRNGNGNTGHSPIRFRRVSDYDPFLTTDSFVAQIPYLCQVSDPAKCINTLALLPMTRTGVSKYSEGQVGHQVHLTQCHRWHSSVNTVTLRSM